MAIAASIYRMARTPREVFGRFASPSLSDVARLFDHAPVGIVVISEEGIVEYVNDRQCANSMLPREFFLGTEYRPTFASTLDASGLLEDYDRLVLDGVPFERTLVDYKRHIDGATVAFSLRGYRAGPWIVLVSTLEGALENQLARYLQLFENANDGVFILSRDGRFVEANRRFCEMVGVPRSELLGQTPERFLPGRMPQSRERLERMMEEGSFGPYELEITTPLGIKHVSLNGFALIENGKPSGVINIARDVTDDHRRAAELRAARDQALESARLKTSFLANMSHEIRTPLNVILGCSSLIADLLPAQAIEGEIADLLKNVQRSGRRLQETIDSILDISRIEAGTFGVAPEKIDLVALVERHLDDFRPLAESRGLEIASTILEPSAVVRFDAYCLNQALLNLISNAIKFTPAGSVRVELRKDASGTFVLEVRDTGVGIDPGFLEKLGQPFVQEETGFSRRFDGCGLGLALTRRYLDLNGARLSVTSEKGKGSVFTIHFEGESRQTPSASRPDGLGRDGTKRRPRVLVVEDDPETQDYMRVLLAPRCQVALAATAEAAVRTLAGESIDLVLMDISLRGGDDGLTLTRMLRRDPRWRSLPIIALTAHAFPENRQEAIEAGCNDFITKPFDARRLIASMSSLLARGNEPAPN